MEPGNGSLPKQVSTETVGLSFFTGSKKITSSFALSLHISQVFKIRSFSAVTENWPNLL